MKEKCKNCDHFNEEWLSCWLLGCSTHPEDSCPRFKCELKPDDNEIIDREFYKDCLQGILDGKIRVLQTSNKERNKYNKQ